MIISHDYNITINVTYANFATNIVLLFIQKT